VPRGRKALKVLRAQRVLKGLRVSKERRETEAMALQENRA
jgi:hypothetical protein